MQIYNYNPTTGEYLNASLADESPLEPGKYLIPAYATEIQPPTAGINQKAVFTNEVWSLVPDYRGQTACEIDTGGFFVRVHEFVLGESPNNTIILSAPPDASIPKPKWNGTNWVDGRTLAEIQQVKIAELIAAFNDSFLHGFPSSATGTQITFGCSPVGVNGLPSDQQNMADELNSVTAGIAVYPILWVAFDGITSVSFTTAAQFKQLIQDFYNYKWTQITNLRTKIAVVQAATTVDQVNAIIY